MSFIAFDNERDVGYITCASGKTGILIRQIGILQEYRGKGLSEKLIAKVFEEVGKNCSGTSVNVSIAAKNAESNAAFAGFCRKNGYVMQKIGDVDLTDIRDEGVKEYETAALTRKC